MPFEKWTALGNDYVILEESNLPWELTAPRIRRVCDPHFGIGSDGVLLLSKSDDPAMVARLRIFNPDGSEAELSGNGAREAVMYLRRSGWTDADEFTIETAAGPVTPTITSERTCTLEMGRASTTSKDFPGRARGRARRGRVRRPHLGASGTSRSATRSARSRCPPTARTWAASTFRLWAPRSRTTPSSRTAPTSASGARDGSNVRARIFERGVGETLSSGTGASGAAVAAFLAGRPQPAHRASSTAASSRSRSRDELDVRLTGWAEPICSGELSPELIQALGEL